MTRCARWRGGAGHLPGSGGRRLPSRQRHGRLRGGARALRGELGNRTARRSWPGRTCGAMGVRCLGAPAERTGRAAQWSRRAERLRAEDQVARAEPRLCDVMESALCGKAAAGRFRSLGTRQGRNRICARDGCGRSGVVRGGRGFDTGGMTSPFETCAWVTGRYRGRGVL